MQSSFPLRWNTCSTSEDLEVVDSGFDIWKCWAHLGTTGGFIYPENKTNTKQLTGRKEKIFGSVKTVLSIYQANPAVSLSKIPWLCLQIEMIDVLIVEVIRVTLFLYILKKYQLYFELTWKWLCGDSTWGLLLPTQLLQNVRGVRWGLLLNLPYYIRCDISYLLLWD